jgi:hypothetical protein
MMSHLEQAYEADIRIRLYDDRPSPDGVVILATDIREGVVYDKAGVKITAFEVDHAPVTPAFGYRIDYRGRSVVLSGDTRQYSSPADVARNIAIFRDAVEAKGEQWDPMRVGVTRAFFVTDDAREREEALERRLANRMRQLKLATTPDGRVLGGRARRLTLNPL